MAGEDCEVRIELIEQEPVNISLVSCENTGITFSILPWVNSHNYNTGDQVQYGGAAYIALRPTVGDNPLTSPLDWELYIGGGSGGGGGTVTAFVFTNANGVTGNVTNATTTPTLTISLGAITPTSIVASGNISGVNLSGVNTGDQDAIDVPFDDTYFVSMDAGLASNNVQEALDAVVTRFSFTVGGIFAALGDKFDKVTDDSDDIVESAAKKFFLATERTKLTGIAAGAEVNVNADWNAVSGDAEILNKPTIPSIANLFNKISDDSDDIVEGTVHLFLTVGERTKLSNTSGTNTGDQTLVSLGGVPVTRTVNGHALSSNVTVTKSDVGLGNAEDTSDANKPISTATLTALNLKADDSTVVHNTGAETITGVKTFSSTIVGSISGNAATVTTNANLTGDVTSVGNAATLVNTTPVGNIIKSYRLDEFATPTASVSLGSQKIINLLNPTNPQEAATKNYVDTANALKVAKAGDTMTGALLMGLNGTTPLTIANPAINASNTANGVVQLNIQNQSSGTSASSDLVATADTGTDSVNYVDLGINSSTYSDAAYNIGGALDAYLYSNGGNLSIGTQSTKDLVFHTDGTTSSKERMRIAAAGGVTIQAPGNITKSVLTTDAVQTVSNKKVISRVFTTTSVSTLTPEKDFYDGFVLTAQAAAINIANHASSTMSALDKIQIVITDNGTARAITFGTNYVAKGGIALPSTTVLGKRLELGFEWDANLLKYVLLAVSQEA